MALHKLRHQSNAVLYILFLTARNLNNTFAEGVRLQQKTFETTYNVVGSESFCKMQVFFLYFVANNNSICKALLYYISVHYSLSVIA